MDPKKLEFLQESPTERRKILYPEPVREGAGLLKERLKQNNEEPDHTLTRMLHHTYLQPSPQSKTSLRDPENGLGFRGNVTRFFLSPFPMWSHFLPSSIDFTLLISLLKMEGSAQPVKGVRAQALTLITPVVAICPISPSFSLFFL